MRGNSKIHPEITKQREIMEDLIVETTNDSVLCRTFFDSVTNFSGLDITCNGKYIGEIINLDLPDENDELELENFIEIIEDWLIDNI